MTCVAAVDTKPLKRNLEILNLLNACHLQLLMYEFKIIFGPISHASTEKESRLIGFGTFHNCMLVTC